MQVIITGGAGFIGSALVRYLIQNTDYQVINMDKLTYAGNLDSLAEIMSSPRHTFEQVDICDAQAVQELVFRYQPEAVLHLAAESHVDRSITGPAEFMQTNILGTYNLLEAARNYWDGLQGSAREGFRFMHVSTDEVYGDLQSGDPAFTEETPYAPSSPYAASKASSDHLVRAWQRTYALPTLITNCSNNYGPYQFPEKLIPLMILNALEGKPLPVYGQGQNIRDWLYVEDHVRALLTVLEKGSPGRTYNIGGNCEKKNIDVVRAICDILEVQAPKVQGPVGACRWQAQYIEQAQCPEQGQKNKGYRSLISFVPDRPGHDQRYAMDSTRITQELGWFPRESFQSGLKKTVQWYLDNPDWVQRVRSGAYRDWIRTNYEMQGRGSF